MCDVSYPLSPFPPFQNTNASLVCVLGFSAAQAYLKYSKKEVCNYADNLHHPDRASGARSAVYAGAAVPPCLSISSTSVVLPWSTWAIIAMFLKSVLFILLSLV